MPFVEDFSPFLSAAEFATTGLLAGVEVRGIFDNGSALGAVGIAGLATTQPSFTLPTAALPSPVVGSALVLGGQAYTVVAHEPDGTGVSLLLLEKA
ncbi:hypothetical protein [Hydrogenophaga sp.]|uniref:head-tail joining protein n=1 Tax=Hydrogenophaga sp. TaxID=1904254 RepID=UPI0025BB8926|nr:hypothetical protein [Hydrogenophaga sp.]